MPVNRSGVALNRRWLFTVVAALVPLPVMAQAWIGEFAARLASEQNAAEELACLNGAELDKDKAAEARVSAQANFVSYWTVVTNSKTANVVDIFYPGKDSRWIDGDKSIRSSGLNAVVDPFAAAGLHLEVIPVSFVRAGDGKSAAGQWIVRDDKGKRQGTYQAVFGRTSGAWKMKQLNLFRPNIYVEQLAQFCHTVGDVLPYQLATAQSRRKDAEVRAAKATDLARQAVVEAHNAQMAAEAERGSNGVSKRAAVQRAIEKSRKAALNADLRRLELFDAIKQEQDVKAVAAELESVRIAGRAAVAAGNQ